MDWRDAYFQQAKSDFQLLQLLNRQKVSLCHQLHYLQMATEKLSKGFATPIGGAPPPKVHRGFVRFLRSVKNSTRLRTACNCGPAQIDAYIASLLPMAHRIEGLAPANADNGPNPEYPWPEPGGITAPADYDFLDFDFNSRSMANMLRFLERCFQII